MFQHIHTYLQRLTWLLHRVWESHGRILIAGSFGIIFGVSIGLSDAEQKTAMILSHMQPRNSMERKIRMQQKPLVSAVRKKEPVLLSKKIESADPSQPLAGSPRLTNQTEQMKSAAPAETIIVPRAVVSLPAEAIMPKSDAFPSFEHAVFPVTKVPNWGIMETPAEWGRTFQEMNRADFVNVPAYDLDVLTQPMQTLLLARAEHVPDITAKLVYSTRYFGKYDLDASEFSAVHPGVDIKLALGTPVGSVAGGKVHRIDTGKGLGLFVVVEHRTNGETFYSIYGHFSRLNVKEGDTVKPGQIVGYVGMTGNTTAPHLHLQIDRKQEGKTVHTPYWPSAIPSGKNVERFTVHPIRFIQNHAGTAVSAR